MEHTKGKWIFDELKQSIVNENQNGILVTVWETYDADQVEIKEDGESWLDMRERTKPLREASNKEKIANLKLIAAAPEMLEMLKRVLETTEEQYGIGLGLQHDIKTLIQSCTE